MQKIKHFLLLWDGIWSIPLAFVLFVMAGMAGRLYFGLGFGSYDPAIFQAALIATTLVVFFNAVAWLGLYLNFRHLYDFYRYDSRQAFNALTSWQKISLLCLGYAGYFVALLWLTLHLA